MDAPVRPKPFKPFVTKQDVTDTFTPPTGQQTPIDDAILALAKVISDTVEDENLRRMMLQQLRGFASQAARIVAADKKRKEAKG